MQLIATDCRKVVHRQFVGVVRPTAESQTDVAGPSVLDDLESLFEIEARWIQDFVVVKYDSQRQ